MNKLSATGDGVSSKNHAKTFFTAPENDNLLAVKRRMQARSESNSATGSTADVSVISSQKNKTNKSNDFTYRPRANFYHSSVSNFGKDGIHFTIGSSRKESKYQPSTPGPGSYDPPINGKLQESLKYKTRFPLAQDESSNGPINVLLSGELPPSLNVEFINKRSFPEIRAMSIGCSRGENNSWARNDNYPGPSFLPKSTLSSQAHKITSRTKIITSKMNNPGPGKYNPDPGLNVNFPKQPAYSCQGPKRRDDWIIKSIDYNVTDERTNRRLRSKSAQRQARQALSRTAPTPDKNNLFNLFNPENYNSFETDFEFYSRTGGVDNINIPNCTGPGPSDYSPQHMVVTRKNPQWTIGKKSRKSKKRKNPNPPKSRFIGIDMFVIPLGLDSDVEADRRYIDEHPAIREMVHEVMEAILYNKPQEPLLMVKEYFMQLKQILNDKNKRKSLDRPHSKLGTARRY